MSDNRDISMMPASWEGVRHRKASIQRCAKGFLVTFAVAVNGKDYKGKPTKEVRDDRAAFEELDDALSFVGEYLDTPLPTLET